MLINGSNKFPKENDVVAITLIGGNEIIGKLSEITEDFIYLQRPCRLVLHMDQSSGEQALAFAPVMMSIDEKTTVRFNRTSISVFAVQPRPDIVDGYTQATSPIVRPAASGLVGI